MRSTKAFFSSNILEALQLTTIAFLVICCLRVIYPFLGALIWATIITISVWPLHCKLRKKLGKRRKLSVIIIVLALALSLAIPIGVIVLSLMEALPALSSLTYDLTQLTLSNAPVWIRKIPAGESLQKLWEGAQTNLSSEIGQHYPTINQAVWRLLSNGTNLSLGLLEIVLAIIMSGVLLNHGERLREIVELLLIKLGGSLASELPEVITHTIRSVSSGVMGTALAQSILCVSGLLIAGVPGALPLGVICFIVAVAQLPTLIVWMPPTVWVFYSGYTQRGVFLLLWGFLLINSIDNILKPLLISQGTKMPISLIFMGIIGGLIAWGVIGLFIGPTLLAAALNMLRHWLRREYTEPMASEARTGGEE